MDKKEESHINGSSFILSIYETYAKQNLYYIYYDKSGAHKFKNLSDELQDKDIAKLLTSIKHEMPMA